MELPIDLDTQLESRCALTRRIADQPLDGFVRIDRLARRECERQAGHRLAENALPSDTASEIPSGREDRAVEANRLGLPLPRLQLRPSLHERCDVSRDALAAGPLEQGVEGPREPKPRDRWLGGDELTDPAVQPRAQALERLRIQSNHGWHQHQVIAAGDASQGTREAVELGP